jgi:hypothetical protein
MQQNPLSLNEVKSHFDHWRAARPKRCKIPEYLWGKVKPLMGRYPLTAITTALSLNTNQIKKILGLMPLFILWRFRQMSYQHHPFNHPNHRLTCPYTAQSNCIALTVGY